MDLHIRTIPNLRWKIIVGQELTLDLLLLTLVILYLITPQNIVCIILKQKLEYYLNSETLFTIYLRIQILNNKKGIFMIPFFTINIFLLFF